METLVLFLPGKSVNNKVEGENILKKLQEDGHQVYFHQWRHWDNPEIEFSVEEELKLITAKLKDFQFDKLSTVGKSIGTYVTVRLLKEQNFNIANLILMGVPFKDLNESERQEFLDVLPKYNGKIVFIHNRNDSHGLLSDIQPILNSDIKHQLIVQENDSHSYDYPEIIELILTIGG